MKKIAIATFYNHDNFGAMLQAYALKKKLNELGAEVSFVSFGDGKTGNLSLNSAAPSSPMIKKILAETQKRTENFDSFRKKYFPAVSFCPEIEKEFDVFVAGSDQIWNSAITGNNDCYYLPFAPDSKKISYAASFGRDRMNEDEKKYLKEKLSGFLPCISVREKSGAALVKDITGSDAAVCLDPVLLTSSDDWSEFTAETYKTPYLLLIMVQNDPVLYKSAKQTAEEKGLALKVISASYFPMIGFDPWSGVPVEKWVNLISGASYVISSSFHGIAFSLIFHRPFTFSPLKNELADRNSRVTELLSSLSLEDRASRFDNDIDWEKIEALREPEKKKSVGFLKNALKERGVLK